MSVVPFVHVDARLEGAQPGDEVPLTPDEVHHLSTVLRLKAGAAVEIADGVGGRAGGELNGRVVRLVNAAIHQQRVRPELVVAQALPKGRKLDEVVRQITEIGVDRILPVTADRCVVTLTGPKADRAVQRWAAVARAAAEQSRQSFRPVVEPIAPLTDLVAMFASASTVVLVAHPEAVGLPHHLDACREAARVVLVVGPEGGLTRAEIELLASAGCRPVGLGPSTLRTEHAAAAATAVLAAGVGRWD